MKVIMQTRAVESRLRTHKLILPTHVVVHTEEQADRMRRLLPNADVRAHGLEEGVTVIGRIRDWLERESGILEPDEWYVGVDDNIARITSVVPELYHQERIQHPQRDQYSHICDVSDIWNALREMKSKLIEIGSVYGGFGWNENPMFRPTKWQYHGYAKAKMYVRRVDDTRWRWNERINVMYDHALTFMVIAKYGRVAVNRFVYCDHPQYEAGGIGSHEERMPHRKPTRDFLYGHFFGLIDAHQGNEDKPVVALRSQNSIDRWRRDNGYLEADS